MPPIPEDKREIQHSYQSRKRRELNIDLARVSTTAKTGEFDISNNSNRNKRGKTINNNKNDKNDKKIITANTNESVFKSSDTLGRQSHGYVGERNVVTTYGILSGIGHRQREEQNPQTFCESADPIYATV